MLVSFFFFLSSSFLSYSFFLLCFFFVTLCLFLLSSNFSCKKTILFNFDLFYVIIS